MKRTSLACRFLVTGLVALPALASGEWRSEGPFVATVSDVAVDPSKPDTIYAATVSGGVWRREDGGATWTLPDDEMVSPNVRWIEVDRSTPGTLGAGVEATGKPSFWRSTDRGATWGVVRVDPTSNAVGQRIAFARTRPKTIFVPSTNLHYRSVDGGKTWKPFREGLPENSIEALSVAPTTPPNLYAVVGFGALCRSADAGATWEELETGLGGTDELFRLAVDPHDPKPLLVASRNGLKASADGSLTFEKLGTGMAAGWTERLWAPAGGTAPVFAQLAVGLFRMDGPGA